MNKKHKLDQSAKLHLISALQCGSEIADVSQAIEYGRKRFDAEYQWRVAQVGRLNALTEWLQGLAINIDFYNHDIIGLAVKWGSLPADFTEKQADKILENYWYFMANKLAQLFDGHRVPKGDK